MSDFLKEEERLRLLQELNVLDTAPDAVLDAITSLAAQICQAPICLVSLVDKDRQWFKSRVGLDSAETPRNQAFCHHTIQQEDVMVVQDALQDPRFSSNPLVLGSPNIRFYAGATLKSSSGHNLGSLCVIDRSPRVLNESQLQSLRDLSKIVVQQLELLKSQRKQKDQLIELVNQKSLLQSFFKTSPFMMGVVSIKNDEIIHHADNPATEAFFQNKVLKKNISARDLQVRDETVKLWISNYYMSQKTERPVTFQYQHEKNPLPRWLQATVNHLPEMGNTSEKFFCYVAQEITEQVLLKEKLQTDQERLMAVTDAMPLVAGLFDPKQNLLWRNPRWKSVFSDGIRTLSQFNIFTKETDSIEFNEWFFDPSKTQLNLWKEWTIRSGQTARVFSFSKNILSNGDTLLIGKDISDRKSTEEKLHEQQTRMLNLEKMSTLGELSSGVAHEVNNPLAIIVGKINLLQKELGKEKPNAEGILKGLTVIKDNAHRISQIINGLRSFARTGKNEPFEEVPLKAMVDSVLFYSKKRALQQGVLLSAQVHEDLKILARPADLSHLLLNLINNSIQAIEQLEAKWIRIETHISSDSISISVTDSGNGIPEPIAQKIMEPFFTTKEPNKGTGLGLSLAQGIAADHKGELTYDAKSPNTRFVLKLPIQNVNLAS